MIFRGWQKTSLIEYPGKVVAVLWLGGCNFRCPWCYNKELVLNPENLPLIKEEEILDFLLTRKNLLDGVMITGGEATINKDLLEFIKKVKALPTQILETNFNAQNFEVSNNLINGKTWAGEGFLVGIETNGYNPEILEKMIKEKLLNFVAMDIKAPLKAGIYAKLAGKKVDLCKIKRSIEIIKNSGLDYEFRTTVVPILTKNDILEIARELQGVKKYVLQQFSSKNAVLGEDCQKMKPYTDEDFEEIKRETKNFGENIKLP